MPYASGDYAALAGVYRSAFSQADMPIEDATMAKTAAGSAIWLGDVAGSPGIGGAATGTSGQRGCPMPELRMLMSGLVFGEQPRWHEGRLWFSDWGTRPSIGR